MGGTGEAMHALVRLPNYLRIEDFAGGSIQLLSTLHALLNMSQLMLSSIPTVETHGTCISCMFYHVISTCGLFSV